MKNQQNFDFDTIIIGSGFGGSVAALRLAEKGYRVLVIEKGKWLTGNDFPQSNWNLKRWLWLPFLGFFGLFKISLFQHVTVLSGVGVGGGSLMYANTLATPQPEFFQSGTWTHLADWRVELNEFYQTALRMLGGVTNPCLKIGDRALQKLAQQMGRENDFSPTTVAVYFGEPDVTVADPYFDGRGPQRTGCIFCGGCMLGCRHDAKNTLDKNYLHLAQQHGATIQAESEVYNVLPLDDQNGATGYRVRWRPSTSRFKKKGEFTCRRVVFAGGVLGTVKLLLALKTSSLPRLSDRVGGFIRTNSESLLGVTAPDKRTVFSDGIAIGSILHTDDYSHLEPVRYPAGSGFWRVLQAPMVQGGNIFIRIGKILMDLIKRPVDNAKVIFVDDWAKRTQILLFMRTLDGHLRFSKGWFGLLTSSVEQGRNPTAFIPEAQTLAGEFANLVNGKPTALLTETLLGIPTTAHILGGCVMGQSADEGVIDKDNRVFGYENMYVCDGSMISANPGVNPALTITALTERAMSKIPTREIWQRQQNQNVTSPEKTV